jgi:hypothetical protein
MTLTSGLAGRNLGMILLGLWLILTGLLPLLQYQDFVHSDNWLSCAGHRGGHVDPDPSLKDFDCGGPDDAK